MHRFLSTATAMVFLPALIAVGALLVVLQVIRAEQESLRRYAVAAERSMATERLSAESERLGRLVRSYLLSPDAQMLEELERSRERFERALGGMFAGSQAPRERELLSKSQRAQARLSSISRELIALRQQGVSLERILLRVTRELQPAREELNQEIALVLRYQRDEMDSSRNQASHGVGSSVRVYLLGIPVAMAVLVAQSVLVMRAFRRGQEAKREAEWNADQRAASEARFAGIVSIAADAIISLDESGAITIFNTGAEAIFGYSASEVLGQPIDLLLPERFRANHRGFMQSFAEGLVSARRMGERRLLFGRRKTGEEFPAEAAISKREVDGTHILTVILRDVSAQKRVEEEQRFLVQAGEILSSSLDFERTLSRVAQLAVQSLADWCIVYLCEEGQVRRSEVAHRMPGKQELAAALRGLPLNMSQTPFLRELWRSREPVLLSHVSAELLSSTTQNAEHLVLLQQLAPRSLLGVPLVVNERFFGALVFIASDSGRIYTEGDLEFARRLGRLASLAVENARLYQAARSATQARDDVLGIVAHDLRSPLNSIVLGIQALRRRARGTLGDAPSVEALDSLLSSAQRMGRLVEDLLDVVRLEAGQLSISPSPQPTEGLLREAVEAARPQAGEVHLQLEESGPLPPVLADRDRLLQVFSNLLGNALKFTPPGGAVRAGARLEGASVCFYVHDTGPGMTPEVLEHIFDRFWQADRRDRRGAGLGLSITKGLVEAHGGVLRVESEPGRGSTFFFTVPVASGPSRGPEPATPAPP
ncbi:PAS domain S-box protein [Archangium minus]|uniref:histidine kinase n=1 Tax=Archangium minus TaxID=83450 RepID=A0ABY9WSS3_9BACT|nr:PAS domain S-box protein [Archangium minus]